MSGKVDVWAAVEEFRQKHEKDLCKIPIDVLTAIEVRLRLDVIPFPDLLVKYSADAAVMSDFSGIYVDEQSYKFLEGSPFGVSTGCAFLSPTNLATSFFTAIWQGNLSLRLWMISGIGCSSTGHHATIWSGRPMNLLDAFWCLSNASRLTLMHLWPR